MKLLKLGLTRDGFRAWREKVKGALNIRPYFPLLWLSDVFRLTVRGPCSCRAMLSGVIMVVLLMCYCCHKSIRKNRPQEYPQYWRTEPDVHSLEVFTTEAHVAVSISIHSSFRKKGIELNRRVREEIEKRSGEISLVEG